MHELIDPITKEQISYHIDKKLYVLLDQIKKYISKNDKDYVLLVDGYEGSGKTTFALQLGKYVDPALNLDRVCMTPETFKEKIIYAQKGQCVICKTHQSELNIRLAVDHDHRTGKIRGLLCQRCNQAIGLMNESTKILKEAVDYLETP